MSEYQYIINTIPPEGEITIREGMAPEIKPPKPIRIKGDIHSVRNFLTIRRETAEGTQIVDAARTLVIVKQSAMSITLLTDPENQDGAEITGSLELAEEVTRWSINQNKTYRKEELVKLIKFNRLFFADAEKHTELLLALQKMESSVSINANESNDLRGNKEREFVKRVVTNIPTEFILYVPVFKGFGARRFRVELCLDVTEGSVRFWLESVELHELIQAESDEILGDQLRECEGLVVIQV